MPLELSGGLDLYPKESCETIDFVLPNNVLVPTGSVNWLHSLLVKMSYDGAECEDQWSRFTRGLLVQIANPLSDIERVKADLKWNQEFSAYSDGSVFTAIDMSKALAKIESHLAKRYIGTKKTVTHDELAQTFGKHDSMAKARVVRANLNTGKVLACTGAEESLLKTEVLHGRIALTGCSYKIEMFQTKIPAAFRDKTSHCIDFVSVMICRNQVRGSEGNQPQLAGRQWTRIAWRRPKGAHAHLECSNAG